MTLKSVAAAIGRFFSVVVVNAEKVAPEVEKEINAIRAVADAKVANLKSDADAKVAALKAGRTVSDITTAAEADIQAARDWAERVVAAIKAQRDADLAKAQAVLPPVFPPGVSHV